MFTVLLNVDSQYLVIDSPGWPEIKGNYAPEISSLYGISGFFQYVDPSKLPQIRENFSSCFQQFTTFNAGQLQHNIS